MRRWRNLSLILSLVAAGAAWGAEPDRGGVEFFEKKIRPVLVEHCYRCHSAAAEKAGKLQAGLRLDTQAGMRRGGDAGPAVVPGEPAKSLLIKALRHQGPKMPSEETRLPEAVIADFESWIKQGAPDPRDGPPVAAKVAIDFEAARRSHWAFQPPRKGPPPAVQQVEWPRGDIDRFILAKLEANGLRPVAPAAPRDLLRRMYFGLIGLPPSPEEMQQFLAESANRNPQSAIQTVVDRLLDSPHYGERWGRHWLDVARYAEDQALAISRDNPHAFRYRDWVIQALQRDTPYDQFLRLQLAGDLLSAPVDDYFTRLAGLGFQGLGQLYHRGNFTEQVMADELDDRIDTVSRGLLGLTVACARCHDHKFDPVPTRDYYSLAAAYQGSNLVELPLASPVEVARHAQFMRESQRLEADLNAWLAEQGRRVASAWLRDLRTYLLAAWQLHCQRSQGRSADEQAVAAERKLHRDVLGRWSRLLEERALGKPRAPLAAWHKAARDAAAAKDAKATASAIPLALAQATDALCREAAQLAVELDKVEQAYETALARAPASEKSKVARPELPPPWQALAKALLRDESAPLFVAAKDVPSLLDEAGKKQHHARASELASFRKAGPPAPRLAHAVSGGGTAMKVHLRGNVERKGEDAPPGFLRVLQPGKNAAGRFTRLDLAEAIVSRDNPLTARVLVNRVWHHHFGRGIVATPSNFGKSGAPPTHPELLDDLAVRFMEAGWSLKWLHRQIMLSQTYQLSSAMDETHRARDPENQLLWRFSPRRLDFEAWRDAVLAVSGRLDRTAGGPSQPVDDSVRRTVYSKISRSRLDPTLAVFDFPDANVSSEQRSVTTVAQQQLFVLNSQFMIASAQSLAARVSAAPDQDRRISFAYRLAYGREPSSAEQAIGRAFLSSAAAGEQLTPWERYAQALLAANEFTWVP